MMTRDERVALRHLRKARLKLAGIRLPVKYREAHNKLGGICEEIERLELIVTKCIELRYICTEIDQLKQRRARFKRLFGWLKNTGL
jgi:hypothetical protein